MKPQKILALLLACSLAFCLLAACGEESSSSSSSSSSSETSSSSSGGSSSSDGDVYRISLSIHDSAEVPKTQYLQKWADEVNEASDGRLEVTVYAGGTLAASTEALDAVKNGTCSAAAVFSGFYSGQFPLSDVITMPLVGLDDARVATNVLWDLYDEYPELQDEYSEYKVIMLYAGPNNIICTNDAVRTVDDMKGLKLRAAAGTATDMTTAWGGTPMNISSSELYQSMERDVINGYIIDFTGVNSWNLYEVTDYFTILPFFTQSWAVLMNKSVYENLPEDLQAIIDDYSTREWSIGFADVNEDEAAEAQETAVDQGCEIIVPEGEDLESFNEGTEEYIQNWISSISTDSFDGQEYFDQAIELSEQYK